MTFEQYFGWQGRSRDEKLVRFLIGLAPRSPHRHYLLDPSRLDLEAGAVPSTGMACQLCAGVVGIEALKLLVDRGPLRAAPWYHQFDVYQGKWIRGRMHGGRHNPAFALKRSLGRRALARIRKQAANEEQSEDAKTRSEIERILERARWAPSGDNGQPWTFTIEGEEHVGVHLRVPEHDVYDQEGEFTKLSGGCLLETMRVAASEYGRGFQWSVRSQAPGEVELDVGLPRQRTGRDPRSDFVELRSVDRRPYQTTPLTHRQKKALQDALGDELEIRWLESLGDRWKMTRLACLATDIRMRIPESFDVHRRVIDFVRTHSATAIPVRSLPVDPILRRMMKWAFKDPRRVRAINRVAGTWLPQLEMDMIPGLASGAHFVVALRELPAPEQRTEAVLRAGMAIQRFWLEAARQGLSLQPSIVPISFGRCGAQRIPFTEDGAMRRQAEELGEQVRRIWPDRPLRGLMFAGRIGMPPSRMMPARSTRWPLEELLEKAESVDHGAADRTPAVRVA
jgi:hypothetical protein